MDACARRNDCELRCKDIENGQFKETFVERNLRKHLAFAERRAYTVFKENDFEELMAKPVPVSVTKQC